MSDTRGRVQEKLSAPEEGVMRTAIILILFLTGCATTDRYQAQCWQTALAVSVIMQSYGYQTEITIQDTETPGVQHAQVRAMDPRTGEAKWCVIDGPWPTVIWGDREAGKVAKIIVEEELIQVARRKAREGIR
jgi:hypothetical protein